MEGDAASEWAAADEPAGKVLMFRDSRSPEQQTCNGGAPRWQQVHEALVEVAQQQALIYYFRKSLRSGNEVQAARIRRLCIESAGAGKRRAA